MTQEEKDAIKAAGAADKKAKDAADADSKKEEVEEADEDTSTETDEEKAQREAAEKKAAEDAKVFEDQVKIEKERREKAEKALADRRFKESEARRQARESGADDDSGDGIDDDKPITARDLTRILASEREKTVKEMQAGQIKEMATTLAGSEAEINAIVEIHRNRSWPADVPLQQQVEEAHAIANRGKIASTLSELKRALKGKQGAGKDGSSSYQDALPGADAKLSPADKAAIVAAGMVWDSTKRLFKKPLGNGKQHLYYDPKSKKRWKA